MEKIFTKKLTKKGFTLAELLIVVAIIAILVAIAAPLFVGALDRAQNAVNDANIRAVKGAAVSEILLGWDDTTHHYGYTDADKKTPAKAWGVEAVLAANGDIKTITITPKTAASTSAPVPSYDKQEDGTYKVTNLEITEVQTSVLGS